MIGGITLFLAAAMGQSAAPESAWLKAVPSDTHVVVRVSALRQATGDIDKMLKAMSPQIGEQAGPAIQVALDQLTAMIGKEAVPIDGPGLVLVNFPPAGGDGKPAVAWLVKGGDYAAFQKAAAGQGGKVKAPKGKLGQVDLSNGMPAYTAQGQGYLAIGIDEKLVSDIGGSKGGVPPAAAQALGRGDIALYANLAEINKDYADQIDQFREMFMQQLARAPGGADQAKAAEGIYAGLFDAIKTLKGLSLSLEFDAKGLTLDAQTYGSKPGTPGKPVGTNLLSAFPDQFAFYYSAGPDFTIRMQDWAAQIGSQFTPQLNQQLVIGAEKYRQAGLGESVTATDLTPNGLRTIVRSKAAKPEALVEAAKEAIAGAKGNPAAGIKSAEFDPPLKYGAYTLSKLTVEMDMDKLQAQAGTLPGGGQGLKKMLNDGKITSWIGSGPGEFISVTAQDEAAAKETITSFGKGATLGGSAGFKELKAALPERADMITAISGQGILRFFSGLLGLELPANLPQQPSYIGVSLTQQADGSAFRLFVPSSFGAIVENGFIPTFSKLSGRVNQ